MFLPYLNEIYPNEPCTPSTFSDLLLKAKFLEQTDAVLPGA